MVHLNRIYTRTGDDGSTSLGNGNRVPKTSLRIRSGGSIDETNCAVGLALTTSLPPELRLRLRQIQNELFDLGADVSVPETQAPGEHPALRITSEQSGRLERWIDDLNEHIEPLHSFVLPGGSNESAALHHARAVCRRAEIDLLQLHELEPVNPDAIVYLNRLSDLLFVAARFCNNGGNDDVLWQPGENRDGHDIESG